jgi:type III secretion system FlhB-like substrate exporter
MYAPKKHLNLKFDSNQIKIMQKAKAYGIATLSNEMLAYELFNLEFNEELEKENIKELLELYKFFDKTIEVAQMSS